MYEQQDIRAQQAQNEHAQQPRLSIAEAKDRLYDKVKIPLKTMDVMICVISALIILAVLAGIFLD